MKQILTLYLQTVLGLSPIETGLVYFPGTFLVFVTSGMTAQFGAKLAPAKIASLGLVLVGAGLAGLLIVDVGSSWTALLPGLLVTSIGTGLLRWCQQARPSAGTPRLTSMDSTTR